MQYLNRVLTELNWLNDKHHPEHPASTRVMARVRRLQTELYASNSGPLLNACWHKSHNSQYLLKSNNSEE